jgi:hypothetical protein
MLRRRHAFGSGSSAGAGMPRMMTMLGLLVVLGMLIYRARDPAVWRWFAGEPNPAAAAAPATANPAAAASDAAAEEVVVPGPRDDDPAEQVAIRMKFDVLTDRAPLAREEMPAYWRLLDWSLSQKLAALEPRAKSDVLYTQLWERPEHYRGQLMRLRLHVMRVLRHDPDVEDGESKPVYELWGWTDDSKSFPYVVVCQDVPAGFRVGGDVREEVVFVGYFLKLMSYESFDKSRASPLLIGRVRRVGEPAVLPEVAQARNRHEFWTMIAVGGAVLAGILWTWTRRKPRVATRSALLESMPCVDAPPTDDAIAATNANSEFLIHR